MAVTFDQINPGQNQSQQASPEQVSNDALLSELLLQRASEADSLTVTRRAPSGETTTVRANSQTPRLTDIAQAQAIEQQTQAQGNPFQDPTFGNIGQGAAPGGSTAPPAIGVNGPMNPATMTIALPDPQEMTNVERPFGIQNPELRRLQGELEGSINRLSEIAPNVSNEEIQYLNDPDYVQARGENIQQYMDEVVNARNTIQEANDQIHQQQIANAIAIGDPYLIQQAQRQTEIYNRVYGSITAEYEARQETLRQQTAALWQAGLLSEDGLFNYWKHQEAYANYYLSAVTSLTTRFQQELPGPDELAQILDSFNLQAPSSPTLGQMTELRGQAEEEFPSRRDLADEVRQSEFDFQDQIIEAAGAQGDLQSAQQTAIDNLTRGEANRTSINRDIASTDESLAAAEYSRARVNEIRGELAQAASTIMENIPTATQGTLLPETRIEARVGRIMSDAGLNTQIKGAQEASNLMVSLYDQVGRDLAGAIIDRALIESRGQTGAADMSSFPDRVREILQALQSAEIRENDDGSVTVGDTTYRRDTLRDLLDDILSGPRGQ